MPAEISCPPNGESASGVKTHKRGIIQTNRELHEQEQGDRPRHVTSDGRKVVSGEVCDLFGNPVGFAELEPCAEAASRSLAEPWDHLQRLFGDRLDLVQAPLFASEEEQLCEPGRDVARPSGVAEARLVAFIGAGKITVEQGDETGCIRPRSSTTDVLYPADSP